MRKVLMSLTIMRGDGGFLSETTAEAGTGKSEEDKIVFEYIIPERYIMEFDTCKELQTLSIDRLFVFQKMKIRELILYYNDNTLFDKNDIYRILCEIDSINDIITKKIRKNKKLYVK